MCFPAFSYKHVCSNNLALYITSAAPRKPKHWQQRPLGFDLISFYTEQVGDREMKKMRERYHACITVVCDAHTLEGLGGIMTVLVSAPMEKMDYTSSVCLNRNRAPVSTWHDREMTANLCLTWQGEADWADPPWFSVNTCFMDVLVFMCQCLASEGITVSMSGKNGWYQLTWSEYQMFSMHYMIIQAKCSDRRKHIW